MSDGQKINDVALAIQSAERCDRFTADDPEAGLDPCDGLEGCMACLRSAAIAAIAALEVSRD